MARQLRPIAAPPHFNYWCGGCEQDYSTTERTPYWDPKGDLGQAYHCSNCAAVENRRRAA